MWNIAATERIYLVGNELELWEHQSSINPNMPLRGLHYFSRLYSLYTSAEELDVFGRKLVKLPAPHYVVFYNGKEEVPDKRVLLLSDAFGGKGGDADLEVRATVLNINEGHNKELMERCAPLAGYAHFVKLVRDYWGEAPVRGTVGLTKARTSL